MREKQSIRFESMGLKYPTPASEITYLYMVISTISGPIS